MKPIELHVVEQLLHRYTGNTVYVHCEVTPGGFMRNIQVEAMKLFISGDGPYRVALKLSGSGWIRIEGLTDYEVDEQERLLMAGHDESGRLTTALELSNHPFEP